MCVARSWLWADSKNNLNPGPGSGRMSWRKTYKLVFLLFRIGQNVVNFGLNLKFKPPES